MNMAYLTWLELLVFFGLLNLLRRRIFFRAKRKIVLPGRMEADLTPKSMILSNHLLIPTRPLSDFIDSREVLHRVYFKLLNSSIKCVFPLPETKVFFPKVPLYLL